MYIETYSKLTTKSCDYRNLLELSEPKRFDKGTACQAAGNSIVPTRYRGEANAPGEKGQKEEIAHTEGEHAGQPS